MSLFLAPCVQSINKTFILSFQSTNLAFSHQFHRLWLFSTDFNAGPLIVLVSLLTVPFILLPRGLAKHCQLRPFLCSNRTWPKTSHSKCVLYRTYKGLYAVFSLASSKTWDSRPTQNISAIYTAGVASGLCVLFFELAISEYQENMVYIYLGFDFPPPLPWMWVPEKLFFFF